MMTLTKNIGLRMKGIRQASGIQQKQLAKKLGILPSLLSMYEQGKREPSISFIQNFSNNFNITLSQFFLFDDQNISKDINMGYSIVIKGLKDVLTQLEDENFKILKEKKIERIASS